MYFDLESYVSTVFAYNYRIEKTRGIFSIRYVSVPCSDFRKNSGFYKNGSFGSSKVPVFRFFNFMVPVPVPVFEKI